MAARKSAAERKTEQERLAQELAAELAKNGDETVVENGQAQLTDSREPEGTDEPKPPAPPVEQVPQVAFDLGAYALTYHKPYFEDDDGNKVFCGHQANWGHESPKAALACLRKAAREHGVELVG